MLCVATGVRKTCRRRACATQALLTAARLTRMQACHCALTACCHTLALCPHRLPPHTGPAVKLNCAMCGLSHKCMRCHLHASMTHAPVTRDTQNEADVLGRDPPPKRVAHFVYELPASPAAGMAQLAPLMELPGPRWAPHAHSLLCLCAALRVVLGVMQCCY
jgi:hypothetical protein